MFSIFFQEGFNHLLPPGAMDHILFLIAICCIYSITEWKKLLWIITSFTIAHSLSLLLSITGTVNISDRLIEFMIACTIAFTCIENIFLPSLHRYRIFISGFFGLIHGLGFSGQLKNLFMGMKLNLWETLVPFNLGLEAAQLVVITIILTLLTVIKQQRILSDRTLNYTLSILILIPALFWIYERNIFTN